MAEPDTFGQRLRAARKGAGLTQRQLAERVGLIHQAIARIEAGQSQPSLDVAFRLADALAVSLESLRPTSEDP